MNTTYIVDCIIPMRIDIFLQKNHPSASRSIIQSAIKAGHVRVNSTCVKKSSHMVVTGDTIEATIVLQSTSEHTLEPAMISLDVLYEDSDCFVINKPAQIAVHPGHSMQKNEVTLLHAIHALFLQRKLPFFSAYTLVHRLDKDTTGCLLIAKHPEAHAFFQTQFQNRTVQKIYIALVAGIPSNSVARIDAPIERSTANRTKMSISSSIHARQAITDYAVQTVSESTHTALVACQLHTGRTHQIRVHLHSIGHPLLGDSQYKNAISDDINHHYNIKTMCLHASTLQFFSQNTNIQVYAPVPASFMQIAEDLQINYDFTQQVYTL